MRDLQSTLEHSDEFKDDIVMVQFKLTAIGSDKTVNTLTFVNVPMEKGSDTNVLVLQEVLAKLKKR